MKKYESYSTGELSNTAGNGTGQIFWQQATDWLNIIKVLFGQDEVDV